MYVNDAREFVRPVEVKPPPKIDERLLEFGDEVRMAGRGHTVGKPQKGLMERGICRYEGRRHACYDYGDYCPAVEPRVYTQDREQPIVFRPMRLRPQ